MYWASIDDTWRWTGRVLQKQLGEAGFDSVLIGSAVSRRCHVSVSTSMLSLLIHRRVYSACKHQTETREPSQLLQRWGVVSLEGVWGKTMWLELKQGQPLPQSVGPIDVPESLFLQGRSWKRRRVNNLAPEKHNQLNILLLLVLKRELHYLKICYFKGSLWTLAQISLKTSSGETHKNLKGR